MADNIFVMYGAREAMTGGLAYIEEQINGIERSVLENPGFAFDLAKTLVESTCKAILSERKISFNQEDDLPKLFKAVTINLPMLPPTVSGEIEARKSLSRTLNGLHTALQGVCELRNAYGFASHGSEGPRPRLESVQAMLAAQAADTIVGFLYRLHCQEAPAPLPGLQYEANEPFNAYIDDAHDPIRIFDLEYRPSEVLFSVDLEAYRGMLAEYEPEQIEARNG